MVLSILICFVLIAAVVAYFILKYTGTFQDSPAEQYRKALESHKKAREAREMIIRSQKDIGSLANNVPESLVNANSRLWDERLKDKKSSRYRGSDTIMIDGNGISAASWILAGADYMNQENLDYTPPSHSYEGAGHGGDFGGGGASGSWGSDDSSSSSYDSGSSDSGSPDSGSSDSSNGD